MCTRRCPREVCEYYEGLEGPAVRAGEQQTGVLQGARHQPSVIM